jgi:exonuclease SbcC|nr:MAG TPA: STRUCTURAL MAINTENANCE OF CHROMOSOMES PROTEIN [Bacteriophage sp.]
MNIKSVEIRGMHNVEHKTYDLHDVNYIYGPNGCGKSTILQAIQLGLLGYIPGYSKKNSDIMKHANGPVMTVKLVFDNGMSIERSWIRNKSAVTANVVANPEDLDLDMFLTDLTMPIFKFDEFLSLSSNKQKEWFLQHMKTDDAAIDWAKEIHEAVQNQIFDTSEFEKEILEEIQSVEKTWKNVSGIELCKQVNAHIKDIISLKKRSIQSLTNILQSLVKYDDSMVIDEKSVTFQISCLEKRKSETEIAKREAEVYAKNKVTLDQYTSAYPETTSGEDKRYIKASETIKKSAEEIKVLSQQMAENDETKSKLQSQVDSLQLNIAETKKEQSQYASLNKSSNTCPFTGKTCEDVLPEIEKAKKLYQKCQDKIDKLQKEIDKLKSQINKLAEKHVAFTNAINEHNHVIKQNESVQTQLTKGYEFKQQLVAAIGNEPLKSAEDCETELANINDELTKQRNILVEVKANKQYNELFEKINNDKIQEEFYLTCLKAWKTLTDVNGLQSTLAAKPFESLAANLTSYVKAVFGENTVAYFNVSSQANSFDFGLKRGDKIVYFNTLSSGEQCLYMFAFMVCLLFGDEHPALPIILLDDVFDHLDNNNVEAILNAINLAGYEGVQFVFAGFNPINERYSSYVIEP